MHGMKRILHVVSLSICVFLHGSAQQAVVQGEVFDLNTHSPLSGVHVIYGEGHGTITSPEGWFSFEITPGTISLVFKYLGYQTHSQSLIVNRKDTVILTIGLIPAFSEIDELVVSPSKSEQKISELNVSTILIRPARLLENHIVTAEEIINQTPGIEVMDSQASIRGGSGYAYGVGSRVLVMIDGMPALAADAGNIKWSFLPLENLSQIEIIKGASSVLYGSSALNGIINFRTQEATPEPSVQFSLSSGIYDKARNKSWVWWDTPRMYHNVSFSFSRRYGNTGIGIGGKLLYDNGYRRLNDEKLGSLNLKIKRHAAKIEGLTYGARMSAGYQEKTDFLLWEDADTGALRQNEATANALHGLMLTIDPFVSFDNNGRFKHDLSMRYQKTRNRLPESSQNNSDATSYYTEYQLSYAVLQKLDLIAGAAGTFSRIISPFYENHNGLNLAGYTQLDYRPFNRLKLQAGLRVEHNRLDDVSDKLIPIFRTGLNYQAGKFTFLRASFGQGYRYPSIAEKFATTTIGSIRIFPNPGIEPESGWSAEIGVKQGIYAKNSTGQFDLSVFYTRSDKLIEYIFGIYPDPVTHEGVYGFQAVNTEHARIYGFEIETALNRSFNAFHTGIHAGYTYIYPAEYDINSNQNTGEFLKYRRKHSLSITATTSYRKFDLGLNMYFRSKILNIDDVFLNPLTRESLLPGFYEYWQQDNKGYVLLDGFLTFHLNEHFSLSFGIKNITNTEYIGRPGDIQPQRNYSLQVSGSF